MNSTAVIMIGLQNEQEIKEWITSQTKRYVIYIIRRRRMNYVFYKLSMDLDK
jgi:hypothetical protein